MPVMDHHQWMAKRGNGTNVEVAVEYPKEQTMFRPKVSMSCTLGKYKTTYLTKKMARKRLCNHRRRTHPSDFNNNPMEDVHDVSNGVIRKKAQMDHEEVSEYDSCVVVTKSG